MTHKHVVTVPVVVYDHTRHGAEISKNQFMRAALRAADWLIETERLEGFIENSSCASTVFKFDLDPVAPEGKLEGLDDIFGPLEEDLGSFVVDLAPLADDIAQAVKMVSGSRMQEISLELSSREIIDRPEWLLEDRALVTVTQSLDRQVPLVYLSVQHGLGAYHSSVCSLVEFIGSKDAA